MGASKKSRNRQSCLGRSLMHSKLKKKEFVEDAIYSKIGQYETKEVSKKISILNKEPVDDFLDNQLVINSVEVTKVFCQKKEIKEKIYNPNKNENVQNIILPIPSRAVFIKNEEKSKFVLLEKENTRDKQNKKNVKKVDFLMKGKHLIPFHNCVGKKEETRKEKLKRLKKEMKKRKNKGIGVGSRNEEEEEEEEEKDKEEEKEKDKEEEKEKDKEEEINEENEDKKNEDSSCSEGSGAECGEEIEKNKVNTNEEKETTENFWELKEVNEEGEINNELNNTFMETAQIKKDLDSKYELKYIKQFEELGNKYDYTNIKEELNKENLDKYELEYFLEWRKLLSYIEEEEGYCVTPYEKNIEYWRQLWRVIEKSHLLFYIIDARNPLFFYCKGFEYYVKKIDPRKKIILILNKADFLSYENRKMWSDYFEKINVQIIFFSALRELYHQNIIVFENSVGVQPLKREIDIEEFSNFKLKETQQMEGINEGKEKKHSDVMNNRENNENDKINVADIGFGNLSYEEKKHDNTDILSINDLINLIKKIKKEMKHMYHDIEIETFEIPKYVVGFVGYPNVGKSSIINCIIGKKRVGVSRKPGKTKHFQTIPLKQFHFTLCDCPGLIFPSLVFSKYDLVINGVFSIDHYKGDFIEIVQILCNIIPNQLCDFYKIDKSIIKEVLIKKKTIVGFDQNGKNSSSEAFINISPNGAEKKLFLDASEFLQALCSSRRYISGGKGGILHFNYATRLIIHDFITGKLLYNFLPSFSLYHKDVYDQRDLIDDSRWDNKIDTILLEDLKKDTFEEIKMSKRKMRLMQKKMLRGKKFVCCPVK